MRIKLPRPQDGPTGLVTVLYGDDLGVGSVCYLGPFAFISEDERKEVDHGFWPEMRYALAAKLKREHWRMAIFCPGWFYHRVKPISYFVYFQKLRIIGCLKGLFGK